jgi:cysteine-rich repeat protein
VLGHVDAAPPANAEPLCVPCTEAGGDTDEDEVCDDTDNCVATANPDQEDADEDGPGDACDNCPFHPNLWQWDCDSDGIGDACDPDAIDGDQDQVAEACDNCPEHPNVTQADADSDDVGDPCDNCPGTFNPGQEDGDSDGWGDLCDNCPQEPNPDQADRDGDGAGDACDPPECGDGVIDLPEECDDRNVNPSDGCDATCHVESCYVCSRQPSNCTLIRNCLNCKDAKAKAAGKRAADLLKAFGRNVKRPNTGKLTADSSRAQARFAGSFARAESKGGCETTSDSEAIEASVDVFIDDIVATIVGSP